MSRIAHLTARVKARNLVNKMANELSRKYAEALLPFVGKKIDKADGSLMESVKKAMPADPEIERTAPDYATVSTFRNKMRHDLVFYVKVSINVEGGQTCVYDEQSMYVGKMDGQVLTRITEQEDRPTDYSVEKVLELREVYKQAKAVADTAFSALHPFGE
jgi:hypothetical protein